MRSPKTTTRSPPSRIPGEGIGDDELELGFVSGIFGVRGEVRLHLHHRESDLLAEPIEAVLVHPVDGTRMAVRISARSGAGKRVLGRIEGVSDRDAAASWMQWRLAVAKEALPGTDDDEFYVYELEGLEVQVDGRRIGVVTYVHDTPGGDVLEIAPASGEEPLFVPLLDDLVHDVDLEAGVVNLRPEAL